MTNMDKQTYDRHVNEARRRYQALDDRNLANALGAVAEGKPRSMPRWEHEALLRTAASRIWNAHPT